jgi:MFS transporter, MHS family, proline/betaine transporter
MKVSSTPSYPTIPGLRLAVSASIIGNGLEWFYFLSYAYFTSTIAHVFFPLSDHAASLMLTLGVFAAGFVVSPIGGVLLGIYADRAGRKNALTMLMVLMAGGTLLIALTPGYDAIGLAAPTLIIAARLIQGLSVGGEFGSAAAMLTEYAPPGKRMFYGSFQLMSQGVALLLASGFAYLLTTTLDTHQLQSWGWRIPFLFGAAIGPVGIYIRHSVGESPEYLRAQTATTQTSDPRPENA